jgi:hypothetical protein
MLQRVLAEISILNRSSNIRSERWHLQGASQHENFEYMFFLSQITPHNLTAWNFSANNFNMTTIDIFLNR